MMDNTKQVNIFQGTGKSVTPKDGSLFAKWNLLKGKAGNVSPSACLPFGSVACSPYSGGYSSGYGNFKPNGKDIPEKFFEGDKVIGFSHFTHSGSGAFGFYYNYLVVTPYVENRGEAQLLKDFDEEHAEAGYYSCRLKKENVKCEVTVSDKVALHRYSAKSGGALKIFVDISNNGLRQESKRLYSYSTNSAVKAEEGAVSGFVTMQGVKLYYYIVCKGVAKLWQDGKEIAEKQLQLEETEQRFGCVFETDDSVVEMKIGFSLVSVTNAMASVLATPDFDASAKIAQTAWSKRLNAVELTGATAKEREIFYSNYYHTLIKPCGWNKESFLWQEKETFYLDFATLWDVYKTQIPLLFALYKDVGRGIVKTLLRYGKEQGELFNALMLTTNKKVESTQACCLGCYVLYDAYSYGLVESSETEDMFSVVKAEISQYAEAVKNGTMEKTTKLLDVTLIARSFEKLSHTLGRSDDERYFAEIAKHWIDAYGADGLLKQDYPYYEGNYWNYSFRFVNDIEKRIALSGGKENLIKQLDAFFAFTDENEKIDRFEGFNNETDMETPYFYHYVNRYDRLATIMQECTSNCFTSGREGLPGNNDSGGLSACYLWNFLGLFPISGQAQVFLGVPKVQKSEIKLSSGNLLTIEKIGEGKNVERVSLNGETLKGYTLDVEKLLKGGTLQFYTVS